MAVAVKRLRSPTAAEGTYILSSEKSLLPPHSFARPMKSRPWKKFDDYQIGDSAFGITHQPSIHHVLCSSSPPPLTSPFWLTFIIQFTIMAHLHCMHASCTANPFVQLARRSYSIRTAQVTAPLEFLVPRCTSLSKAQRIKSPFTSSQFIVSPQSPRTRRRLARAFEFDMPRRAFSTTLTRQQTRAILNPQRDEDGNEMMLEITDRAAKVCCDHHLI